MSFLYADAMRWTSDLCLAEANALLPDGSARMCLPSRRSSALPGVMEWKCPGLPSLFTLTSAWPRGATLRDNRGSTSQALNDANVTSNIAHDQGASGNGGRRRPIERQTSRRVGEDFWTLTSEPNTGHSDDKTMLPIGIRDAHPQAGTADAGSSNHAKH